jgi:general secretion pathway protein C
MSARLLAFVVWAAVAASAMFWILRMTGAGMAAPSQTASVAAADVPRGDWARLFPMNVQTAASAPVVVQDAAAASRFKLVGVAAPRWASISVDNKPPRSVALGATVDGDWVVQTIQAKEVAIGPRGDAPVFTLSLAGLPPPATGTLPMAGAASPGVAPPPGNSPLIGRPPLMAPPAVSPTPMALPPDAMAPGAVLSPPKPGDAVPVPDPSAEQPPPQLPVLTR